MPRVRDFDTPLSDDDEQRSDADTVRRFAPTPRAADAPPQADVSGPAPEGGRTVPPPNGHPPDWRDLYPGWAMMPVEEQEDTDRQWGKMTLAERARFMDETRLWREGLQASVERAGFHSPDEYLDWSRRTYRREFEDEERQREREAAVADMPDEVGPSLGTWFSGFDASVTLLDESRPDPYLIDRFVVNNGLSIIAGHPKTMKSLALLQAGFSFAARVPFLGLEPLGDCYPVFAYVTEEGSRYEMGKRLKVLGDVYEAGTSRFILSYLNGVTFTADNLTRMEVELDAALAQHRVLAASMNLPLRVLLALDPLRDFIPPGSKWSENDAQDMGRVKAWVRSLLKNDWLSIVLVHHLRKATEGDTGLEMAGSGATYGAVDSTITWKRDKEKGIEDRDEEDFDGALAEVLPAAGRMRVETRGDATWGMRWNFNPSTGLFQREPIVLSKTKSVIVLARTAGTGGVSPKVVAAELGISPRAASARLGEFVTDGTLVRVSSGRGPGSETRFYAAEFAPTSLLPREDEESASDDEELGSLDPEMFDPLHSV